MNMQFLAKMFEDAIYNIGCDDVSVRYSYSGRGMYGKTCPGITGGRSDCMQVIAYVIKEKSMDLSRIAREAGRRDTEATEEELFATENDFDRFVGTLLNFDQDSMGRDIIFYWPELDAFDLPESGPVRDSYEDYCCPDCGEEIPLGVVEGEECKNCGHVFSVQRETDNI